MGSNIEQLERQLSELDRTEGTVEVEDEDADEMMDAIDIPDAEDVTLDIVRDLLPNRAELRDDGQLWVEVISNHEADNAKLTDKRKEIIKYIHDHPIKTVSAVARALDTADSYIRSTKRDFRFLLRNETLFDYFILGDGIPEDAVDDQEEEEVEQGEENPADVWRVGSQDSPACEALALPEGDASDDEEPPTTQDGTKAETDDEPSYSELISASSARFGVDVDVEESKERGEPVYVDGKTYEEWKEEKESSVEINKDEGFSIIAALIKADMREQARDLFNQFVN